MAKRSALWNIDFCRKTRPLKNVNEESIYYLIMQRFHQTIPLIVELFINGLFIVVYSLDLLGKMPSSIPLRYVDLFYQVFLVVVPFIIVLSIVSNFILSENIEDFFRKYVLSFFRRFRLYLIFLTPEYEYSYPKH